MRKARSNRGFSLPEVLIALTVFGVASTGLVATSLLNVRSNRVSNEVTEATTLAQSWIEYVRAQTITDASSTVCPSGSTPPSVPNPYGTPTCTLGTAASPVAGTRPVTVTVRWSESDTGTRSVTLQSYVTY
jgi:prepilin-type N-terminal cleavage/methylation domain-containing protein